ncbi:MULTISPECIES: alanine dehydrogenase [unclassified Paenibacillus]|uniref:alanine dehydrogenase n=1 Tax=unclassified Paenibacillus TaxID=185978 RepID=UPI00104D0058|nr:MULTISPECIES: alanine dehydrogenase [unclassified Paenibacillus]NIK67636.1 alanine dehydrogenase [Paenibacillus sp. BK720]TCN01676.1 alanine dehydrogenase [Paenibacillus sp. BK033]
MIIGVPKEIKSSEYRVALTPAGVTMLKAAGHKVIVETRAGEGSGFEDRDYELEGAEIRGEASEVWKEADMIMKVKEPLKEEFSYFREGLILFTYLHLAAAPELTRALMDSGVTGIAYETIQLANGSLPLLTPMSEVAGRMAVQVGSQFLEAFNGGRGVLLGGVPGVPPAEVVIIGGGIVGTNAAKIALGMGANVVVLEKSTDRMRYLDDVFGGRLRTLMSSPYNIADAVGKADLLIGAVLIPGAKAPHLVTETMVQSMKKGSVIVDVAVDQGGSIATVDRPTTHKDPIYMKHGVVHYAVANIPGAVPRTSTFALTNVTMPYALDLASRGWEAIRASVPLQKGVNTYRGTVTYEPVAAASGLPYTPLQRWLDSIAFDNLEP